MVLKTSLAVLTFLAVCSAQQSNSNSNVDKQVRLEDIERDTLSSTQQRQQTSQQQQQSQSQQPQQQSQHQQAQQQYSLTQQQLAAYQQQLLLQQLQQQYFAPQPITYPSYNAVPLMIIPGNHLGVGSPALPLQAYFLPDPIIFQQPAAHTTNIPAPAAPASVTPQASSLYQVPAPRLQPTARYQPVGSNQLSQYRIPQAQQPIHNFVYTSTPPQVSAQQQLLLQQQSVQQPYNAYNAIYQQRPQKNLYSSGIKSTPAPPSLLKTSAQNNPISYSQTLQNSDQTSSSYINYKSF